MDVALKGFHAKSDEKSSTKSSKSSDYNQGKNVRFFFGYYEAKQESCEEDKSNPNAFIFSLINKDNKPGQMNVADPNRAI